MSNPSRNTRAKQVTDSFKAGYAAGLAGNEHASPPYMVGSIFTESLIQGWKDGHAAGLATWRLVAHEERLKPLTHNGMSIVPKRGAS